MSTVTEELASSLLSTDVKNNVPPGQRNAGDIQLFNCLAEEAVSGLPMADAALEQLESMLLLGRNWISTSDRDDELRVEPLNLLSVLLDRLTTSDKQEQL